jgi:2-keto-4-pentenoate hydratase/2-oxohepta-3-ene-1,7-dioic acid hydratase in catechol pathway
MGQVALADIRLLRFDDSGSPRAGVLIDGHVYAAAEAAGDRFAKMKAILADLPGFAAALKPPAKGGRPVAGVKLLAPLAAPGTIFCAGANYWDHMNEMAAQIEKDTGSKPPVEKAADPWFFIKASQSCVADPGATVPLPSFSKMMDWEAEIALVIGKPAKNVSMQASLDHVAGFTILNDLSARDFIKREGSPFIYDWIGQKSFDGAAPMGPWFTPTAAIPDPEDMSIKLWVNDVLKQDSNSGQIIHDFREQIVYLSSRLTLNPGDVIATGTPAGVGLPKGEFLKAGDTVRIEVGGCGVLENSFA